MDKDRVLNRIRRAKSYINDIGDGLSHNQRYSLNQAMYALQEADWELKKPDGWISVRDKDVPSLDSYNSWNGIIVCNGERWMTTLSEAYRRNLSFTHWRKIEKPQNN